jgi:hypothetical protein
MSTPTTKQRAADNQAFMDAMRGIPGYAVAIAMSGRGIDFRGCNKAHLAEAWAKRNEPGSYETALKSLTLEGIATAAKARITSKQQRDSWQAELAAEISASRLRVSVRDGFDRALPHLMLHQALDNLDAVLNCRTFHEQADASIKARDFLAACGR